jgi:hypothetical protein
MELLLLMEQPDHLFLLISRVQEVVVQEVLSGLLLGQ